MKTIAIANQKGGTGKTTTTYNLGIALTQQGYRVLMVDFGTPTAQVHVAKTFSQELATTFTTDIIQCFIYRLTS